MIRVLNLLIITLHAASDIRRRVTLPATAALLTVTATLIIARTVTADSGPARTAAAQPPHIAASRLQHVPGLPPVLRPASNSQTAVHAPAARSDAIAARPDTDMPAVPASGMGAESSAAAPAPAVTTPPADASIEPAAPATVQLAPPQFACEQGQWQASIASATLTLAVPVGTDTPVTWYWETRMDSGPADAPPVLPHQATQTVPAGQTVLTIVGAEAQTPLLTAPQAAAYAYSVRLHVTTPFDAASDWAAIPQAAGSCAS